MFPCSHLGHSWPCFCCSPHTFPKPVLGESLRLSPALAGGCPGYFPVAPCGVLSESDLHWLHQGMLLSSGFWSYLASGWRRQSWEWEREVRGLLHARNRRGSAWAPGHSSPSRARWHSILMYVCCPVSIMYPCFSFMTIGRQQNQTKIYDCVMINKIVNLCSSQANLYMYMTFSR